MRTESDGRIVGGMSDKPLADPAPAIVEDQATKDALDLLASRLRDLSALADQLSRDQSIADFAYLLSDLNKSSVAFQDRLRHARANRGKPRGFGLFAGKFEVGDEFFEPLPEEELRAWGET